MSDKTEKIDSLIEEVHKAFGDIPFPSHCGWNAAIARDDWIDTPIELKKITDEKDFKGKWWEIPEEELDNCYMAQCYLDSKGVQFYLPAYLIMVLNDYTKLKHKALISWLLPPEKNSEYDLYPYFLEMFSKINHQQKEVCLKVIKFIETYDLDKRDPFLIIDITAILKHDFWIK